MRSYCFVSLYVCSLIHPYTYVNIYGGEHKWNYSTGMVIFLPENIGFQMEKKSSVWGKMLPFRLLVSRGTRDFPETIQALVIVQSPTSA